MCALWAALVPFDGRRWQLRRRTHSDSFLISDGAPTAVADAAVDEGGDVSVGVRDAAVDHRAVVDSGDRADAFVAVHLAGERVAGGVAERLIAGGPAGGCERALAFLKLL